MGKEGGKPGKRREKQLTLGTNQFNLLSANLRTTVGLDIVQHICSIQRVVTGCMPPAVCTAAYMCITWSYSQSNMPMLL